MSARKKPRSRWTRPAARMTHALFSVSAPLALSRRIDPSMHRSSRCKSTWVCCDHLFCLSFSLFCCRRIMSFQNVCSLGITLEHHSVDLLCLISMAYKICCSVVSVKIIMFFFGYFLQAGWISQNIVLVGLLWEKNIVWLKGTVHVNSACVSGLASPASRTSS